jgi:hypothetical protein
MTDDSPQEKPRFRLSRILRYAGFAILLMMLVLSVIFQFTQPQVLSDEEIIAATVQAGVNLGLTEVMVLTGTPDATAIQATIEAGIEATLTNIQGTPQAESSNTGSETGAVSWIANLFNAVLGFIMGIWNFAGQGGIFIQVCCCIVPIALVVVGIIND